MKPWETLEIKDPYERGFIEGMEKQRESSVDKYINGQVKTITDEGIEEWLDVYGLDMGDVYEINKVRFVQAVRAIIKEITE